jgi:alpha-galactosidase
VRLSLGAACLVCAAGYAQTVTGTWTGPANTVDNGQEITVALEESGGTITGYVVQPRGLPEKIASGVLEGNQLTLASMRPGRGGTPVKIVYNATIEGDRMKFEMPAAGRGAPRPGQILNLTRVSKDAPKPLAPRPAPVSLPMPAPVKSNGLARTPPMGWNSWNKFRNQVSDRMVREMADAIVSSGMRDAGYIYVNIDDTWEAAHRDAQGNIATNNKFPDMKALSDYVHSKSLKLGIYSSPGPKTCAGYEGSYQHEEQDARTFARWGIDYLKYDWCAASQVYTNNDQATMAGAYAKMGLALLNSGRPIVYSLCQYGNMNVEDWGERVGGNLWRTTGDIADRWPSMSTIGFEGTSNATQAGEVPDRAPHAGPGHWNDPDMLEIGNGNMTDTEYQTHMSLWCLEAAPLLAGNDIRSMSPAIAAILMNKEAIAIDQDPLGRQGTRVSRDGQLEVWSKPLADGGRAVGLFNRGETGAKITAKWSDIGLTGSHKVRDLWKHADLGSAADGFSAEVPPHGVVFIRVAK